MKKQKNGLTRRDFLKGAAGSVLTGMTITAGSCKTTGDNHIGSPDRPKQSAQTTPENRPEKLSKSRVVLIRSEHVIDKDGRVDPDVLTQMLDDGVAKLFDKDSPQAAWSHCLSKDDTLGIKTNVWSFLRTPEILEQAVRARAMALGIPAQNIGIDDRSVLDNPVFQKATALINMRPIRTHHWSGIGGLIKNYIMFSDSPPKWHPDACADLAGVWNLPLVRGKTRLNVLVALVPLFHGKGPHHYQSRYQWPYKGLLLSTDPVAADAVGLTILTNKRKSHFKKHIPLVTSAKHVQLAQTRHGLGLADPERIELVKMGWMEDALI